MGGARSVEPGVTRGRFSEDFDFTLDTDRTEDDVLTEIVEVFNREHHGITFTFDEYYKTEDDTSFGGDVLYRHAWNDTGRFRLQVSLRERPTLAAASRPTERQAYFDYLEFDLFNVRALEPIEMIAEEVRAAFQRAKVRDLYDLHRFAGTPFDVELLRRLVVLTLWQVRDPFDPETFFTRLKSGVCDWEDIRRLVRSSERIKPDEILASVDRRFAAFRELSELEQPVITDAKSGWNEPLAERLRSEIRDLAGQS